MKPSNSMVKLMEDQINMKWLQVSVGKDRTFLSIFSICIEWERGFNSIIPFSPSLSISWSRHQYMDREITFVWNGLPYPIFEVGFRINHIRKEFSICPIEGVPQWVWNLLNNDS